jgi:hypothetical protein
MQTLHSAVQNRGNKTKVNICFAAEKGKRKTFLPAAKRFLKG